MSERSAQPVKITMRRTTIDRILSVPALPAPLRVRRAQVEESQTLAALLGRAYPAETWDPVETEREFFHDQTVKAPMVVVSGSQILATASLQIRTDTPEYGWIRWVATELDQRRRGLAQTLIIRLLVIAVDAGCREVRLNTTTDLQGAIAMYVKLGFEPLIDNK